MSAKSVDSKKPTPTKARTGRCLAARCSGCTGYSYERMVAGWSQCSCGHSQAIHDTEEKTT